MNTTFLIFLIGVNAYAGYMSNMNAVNALQQRKLGMFFLNVVLTLFNLGLMALNLCILYNS